MPPALDLSGAFLEQVVGRVSPQLRAALAWRIAARQGDPVPRLLDALVEPGTVAVDCGASWGVFTFALARRVGPGGRVHAFEPNPVNARSLAGIAAAAEVVEVHAFALSERAGSTELHLPRRRGRVVDAMGSLTVPAGREGLYGQTVAIEVKTLDDALGPDADRVAFLKCDVEGHELAVLRGAKRTLSTLPALLIEIEQRHQSTDVSDTFDLLRGLGYEGYVVRPGGLRPVDEFDVHVDQLDLLDLSRLQPVVPEGYAHDFVFVAPGTDLKSLRAGSAHEAGRGPAP